MSTPDFVFVLHLHQPVGNFDHVFAQHARDVYIPLLQTLSEHEILPLGIHVSGPLLEWMEANEPRFLDRLGRLAADGEVEMLASGFYEPVLAALDRRERSEQIGWMRDRLRSRFGVEARGLWLTERVWESGILPEIDGAGIEYLLLDDWHFKVSGIEADRLGSPFELDADGGRLRVLPIHESLRYLIPFRPATEIVDHFRTLGQSESPALAVFGDDGEKFGGWPGTYAWVWESGWMPDFVREMAAAVHSGLVALRTPSEALARHSSAGLAYLGSSSYREMEEWALPLGATQDFRALVDRAQAHAHPRLRGSHWKNFLVRYPEANRLHKKAHALSLLARSQHDPEPARRAIGRAQGNDPYWHGMFGGVYMKHLREAAWRSLADAEAYLRAGQPLHVQVVDIDADGAQELWVHSHAFSALVSPARGGRILEWTHFGSRVNYADVLTRREEAYHAPALERGRTLRGRDSQPAGPEDGTASIHDLEHGFVLFDPPACDREDRSLVVARVLDGEVTSERYAQGVYTPVWEWPARALPWTQTLQADALSLRFAPDAETAMTLSFVEGGAVTAQFNWNPDRFPADAWFSVELSISDELIIDGADGSERWSYPIVTVPRSELGFEWITQGISHTLRWPSRRGEAGLRLTPMSGKAPGI